MGVNKMFWPQELLDEWMLEERVVVHDEQITIPAEKRSYRIEQALFFQADVADGSDPHKLVGRVKRVVDIQSMGGEHYMDSVVLGDTAYSVVSGFTGEPQIADSLAPPANKTSVRSSRAPSLNRASLEPQSIGTALSAKIGEAEDASDQELLAKFLLENL